MRISGIEGIRTVKTSKKTLLDVPPTDAIDKKNNDKYEYVIFEADGTNMRACLSHDRIDPKKTYSNDMT